MSPNGLYIQLLNCWFSQDLNLTILIIRSIGAFVGLCLNFNRVGLILVWSVVELKYSLQILLM